MVFGTAILRQWTKKPFYPMKPQTLSDTAYSIPRALLDIMHKHGHHLSMSELWEHAKKVKGLGSKSHMKLVLRRMKQGKAL